MTSDRPLFGSLALSKGLCTLDELDVALDAQRGSDPRIPLGQVLLDMGKLTPEQVKTLLALQGVTPAVARLVQEAGPALDARVVPAGERLKIGDVVLRAEGMSIEIVPTSTLTPSTATVLPPPAASAVEAPPLEAPRAKRIFAVAHETVGKILPFLHPHRTYALLAALPGLVALVLPWRLFGNGVWSYGVQGPGWVTFLLTASAAGLLLLGDRPRAISRGEKIGVLALSGLALLLSLWKLFSAPDGATAMGLGIPLALISAALLQLVAWPMKAVEGDPARSAWARVKGGLGELTGKRAQERTGKMARRDALLKQAGEAALASTSDADPDPVKKAREAVDAPGKPIPGKRERAILRLGRAAVDAGLAETLAEEVRALDASLAQK